MKAPAHLAKAFAEASARLDATPDSELSAEQLDDRYNPDGDGQHPRRTRGMWQACVAAGDTLRGYWDWVAAQIEEEDA